MSTAHVLVHFLVQIMMFSDCSMLSCSRMDLTKHVRLFIHYIFAGVETKRRKYNIQTNSLGTFLHPVTQAAGILGVRCFGRCHN
jgi:hypothetical protein